jgi:integrase
MRRKKILIYPHLCDRKGDISKKWYVELSQRNPQTDQMERRRFEIFGDTNINDFNTPEERRAHAEKIIEELRNKIAAGWTIFNDTTRVVYADQTQYAFEARVFKKMVESNLNTPYWLSRYINEQLKPSGLRPETIMTYTSRCRIFRLWIDANGYSSVDITAIDNSIIVPFFTYLRNDRQLSRRAYNSYAEILIAFFNFVIKQKGMTENPVHTLPDNRNNKDMGAERIQRDDLRRLYSALDSEDRQLALACRFEYYCGLRPGYEVRLLRVGDIDFREGYSKVRILAFNSKKKQRREVILPDDFRNYLVTEWQLHKYDKNLYIFGQKGKPGMAAIGKNTLRRRFNKIRDRLNMPIEYKLYSMKHTGATMLAEQGEPIINIRDHLGHTSIATTEHYLNRHGVNNSPTIRHNFPPI